MQLKLYDKRPTLVQLHFVCQSTLSTHKKKLARATTYTSNGNLSQTSIFHAGRFEMMVYEYRTILLVIRELGKTRSEHWDRNHAISPSVSIASDVASVTSS